MFIVCDYHYVGHQRRTPELRELNHYSVSVSPYWKDLALELKLPYATIEMIDGNCSHITDKCREMFNTWLQRSPNACWCYIVNALKVCSKVKLAEDIEESFLSM